ARLGDGLPHHLGHHRPPEYFAQMPLRHPAWPESLEPRPALQLVETRRATPLAPIAPDHHLQPPPQSLCTVFRALHTPQSVVCSSACRRLITLCVHPTKLVGAGGGS